MCFSGYEVSYDLLGAIKAWVTQALSSDNMTDAIKTVTAVVLAVLAVCAVGATHLTPMTYRRNAMITVIFNIRGNSTGHKTKTEKGRQNNKMGICFHGSELHSVRLFSYLSPIHPGLQ